MNSSSLVSAAVHAASIGLRLKARTTYGERSVALARSVHLKQVAKTETDLTDALVPFFEKQAEDAAAKLRDITEPGDDPTELVKRIFSPTDWDTKLVDTAAPPLLYAALSAALAQLKVMGVPVKKLRKSIKTIWSKESTASEWLRNLEDDELRDIAEGLPELVLSTPWGVAKFGIATELPVWMRQEIVARLSETFSQPYWSGINQTTLQHIETVLRTGLQDGWSITRMADQIAGSLGGPGAEARGRNIARTESGHALNSARTTAADGVIRDLQDANIPAAKVWLSVLGTTTRLEHANLDGVPADEKGEWLLAGTKVRWPGDVRLGPGQRCNCMCTIRVEFGMDAEDVQAELDAYADRLAEEEKRYRGWWLKKTRDYSCLMLEIPEGLAEELRQLGHRLIADEDVADGGREDWPHITVLYGLHTDRAKDILADLSDLGPVPFRLGEVRRFTGTDNDVAYVSVVSDVLLGLRKRVELYAHTSTHDGYTPHVTLAYTKSGAGSFEGPTGLPDDEYAADRLVFSSHDERKTEMTLDGSGTTRRRFKGCGIMGSKCQVITTKTTPAQPHGSGS